MRVASPSGYHLCRRLQQLPLGAFDEEVAVRELRRGQQERDRGFERGRVPEVPQKVSNHSDARREGKRGRTAKSDAHNLHEALLKLEESVLRFMSDPDVSFTNNTGEQKIRMSKVKVSGCFRTKRYAHAWCRISSYLDSMKALGYNPHVAIRIALAGNAADMIKHHDQAA